MIQQRGAWRLAAVDDVAARAGLTPGMPLADARARLPDLDTRPADAKGDRAALTRLAHWAGRYTPWTNIDNGADDGDTKIGTPPAAGLWLDVTGCAHLFGGEDALLADLCRRLKSAGYTARAGLAATPGAAWALARFGTGNTVPWRRIDAGQEKDALADLPVAGLRLADETTEALMRLGLRRIGDLYPLSRAALALRFGLSPCLRLDQALGDRDEPLSPLAPPPRFQVRLNFPEPIGRADDIAQALERLLAALTERLARAGKGARRLEFTLYRVDGTAVSAAVGTARPMRDAAHLAHLFHDKLDGLDPGFGIETALLAARAVDPLAADQAALDGDGPASSAPDSGLARLIDRLANRLGPGGVAGLRPRDSHLPERAQALGPPMPGKVVSRPSNPMQEATPRPIHLLPQPEPVDVVTPTPLGPPAAFRWRRHQHRVVSAEGPERIAPEWWRHLSPDGGPAGGTDGLETRDYYRVEDDSGARFWLYRTGGFPADAARDDQATPANRPRPGQAPKWFLHGLFP